MTDRKAPIDPDHYVARSPEPIEVIEAWRLNYPLGNAVKYIARADHPMSNRRADLLKAANYLFWEATGKWLPKELVDKHD